MMTFLAIFTPILTPNFLITTYPHLTFSITDLRLYLHVIYLLRSPALFSPTTFALKIRSISPSPLQTEKEEKALLILLNQLGIHHTENTIHEKENEKTILTAKMMSFVIAKIQYSYQATFPVNDVVNDMSSNSTTSDRLMAVMAMSKRNGDLNRIERNPLLVLFPQEKPSVYYLNDGCR